MNFRDSMNRSVGLVGSLLLASGLAVGLSACKVGPDYKGPPEMSAPGAFAAVPGGAIPDVKSVPAPGDVELAAWWKQFGDAQLDSLVEKALVGNLDLQLAQARVKEARAARGIVVADWFPAVGAGGNYQRSRSSDNIGFIGPNPSGGTDLYTAGFDASWEIDFWGKTARGVEAADAVIAQTVENRRDVMISLLAEVASNYITLRGQQERLSVTERAVKAQEDSLKLTESRFRAGLVGELDVSQAKAQLENRNAQLFPIKTEIERAINRIGVLLGKPPRAYAEELSPRQKLPVAPAVVNVGMPSELLKRRPDIRAAERALASQTARIGVATADLYPSFSITAALGLQSNQFGSWWNMSSRYWNVVPGVSWPILDWGKIRSNIQVADARAEQSMIIYEQVVLSSFENVESSLLQMVSEQQRYGALTRSVEASARAVQLAEDLYQTGNVDFRTVLDNQLILYNAEDQAVISQTLTLTSMIGLYKSLGGGWEYMEQDPWTPKLVPSSTISAVVDGLKDPNSSSSPPGENGAAQPATAAPAPAATGEKAPVQTEPQP
ncbi:MAG: efflux transporter outer membrane subunit [Phycisphaerae bacterium]|nr:efflux transporter outer membrane subunit [Phycisphaerae bacterium]MBN8596539.1 efflux transporter outer membrane subunit [Planctomycetota bacterium]